MPIQLILDGREISVRFPSDVSQPPVCIDTSSSDTTVTFPSPIESKTPLLVSIEGNGSVVTFPTLPPITLTTGGDVSVEFPTGGTIVIPRGKDKPIITVKGGKLIPKGSSNAN